MSQEVSSFAQSYKTTIEIANNKASALKKSYLLYILSYITRGLGFAFFFPLLSVMFSEKFILNDAFFWFGAIVISTVVSLIFHWLALEFNYSTDLTDVTHNLRVKLGNKIKTMPLQRLNKYRTGELNSILATNVDQSVLHMGIVAGMGLEALIVPIVIVLATFFINVKMAFAMLLAFPLAVPIYKWSRGKIKVEKIENVKAHSTLEADTIEYLQGLPVLRSINQVGVNAKNLQKSIAKAREVQKKGTLGATLPMVVMITLIEFVFLMVLSLGALWIADASISIATLVALLVVLGRLSEPLANFLAIASVLDTMEIGFKHILGVLRQKDLKINEPILTPKTFDIKFNAVDFNYLDYDNKAMDNVSFHIKANSLTAIVGPSGSGKTTITKLIMRYDDPSCGNVEIGGVDIKNMTQVGLMSYISVVFQDVYLFDDTILNNIRMGKPSASDEEVQIAAQKAYCHEFITRLPHGYETTVGEIGGNLSGGEKQRISIARAILKDAPIVILDEPTSALDTQSEVAVQNALDELIQDKTVIVIAHRLSTISHANTILVMQDGTITEQGSHKELIDKKGKYYDMFQAQQRIKQWNL
ncbi:ABC transporter ATP-binding protein [Sulfurimonas sp.]|uniref:ABC transporter ATP-binding protein n=1 Tax=Sulfurimonas sp. TaxID=2022749 RepID=UPI002B46FC06|nr:ABC transporter ATP-binding protein [Sulfurimonas sp.]